MSLVSPDKKPVAERGYTRFGVKLATYQKPRMWEMLQTVMPEIQQGQDEAMHWTGPLDEGRGGDWLGNRTPRQVLDTVISGAPLCAGAVDLPDIGEDTMGVGCTMGPYGASWDVGALLAGDPNPAMMFQQVEGANRIVRIVVNSFVSWSVDAETYARRGQAIATLIETLRVYGFEAQVTLVKAFDLGTISRADGWSKMRGKHVTEVEIVGPGEVLDPQRVAWMIGDIGAIRGVLYPYIAATMGFTNSQFDYELNGAIKTAVESEATAIYLDPVCNDGGEQMKNFATPKKAKAWVTAQIAKVRRACGAGTEG